MILEYNSGIKCKKWSLQPTRGPAIISVIEGLSSFPRQFYRESPEAQMQATIKSDRRTKENELAWTKTVMTAIRRRLRRRTLRKFASLGISLEAVRAR